MLNTIKPLGIAGVNKDLPPSELPPNIWSDALNVRFRNAQAEKRKGISDAYSAPSITPYGIECYTIPDFRYIVSAGLAAVYAFDGAIETDITRISGAYTATTTERWSLSVLNGILIAANPNDDPQYWAGDVSQPLLPLTGWTTGDRARAFRVYKDFIFALGPTLSGIDYPYLIKWSASAEPGSIPTEWTATATNNAGDSPQASDTGGEIVDGKVLGDALIVYKRDARYAVRYIGGNDVFNITKLPGNDGLLALNCVADTPKGHVFVTNDDIKIHAGGEAVSIAEGRVKKYFFDNLDFERSTSVFAVPNLATNEVWIAFPTANSTDCETAIVWNWQHDTWSIFSFETGITCASSGLIPDQLVDNHWSGATSTWSAYTASWVDSEFSINATRLIVANSTPAIGVTESGTTDFGVAWEWYVEKTGIHFDNPQTKKVLSWTRPQFIGAAGAQATCWHGSADGPSDTPTYNANTGTYTVGSSDKINRFAQAGRYLAVKYGGSRAEAMALRSADMLYHDAGTE